MTYTLAFFLLVAILFPLAIGPDAALLARVGGGVIWAAALLAALMPVERLIGPDAESGVLDQFAVRGLSMASVAAAKIVAHWLALRAAPDAGGGDRGGAARPVGRDGAAGRVGAADRDAGAGGFGGRYVGPGVGIAGAGAVAGLVMLPLAVPLLIFGAGSIDGGMGAVKLLAAVSLMLVAGAPFVAGAAMRAGMD